jgi:tubulin-specific chaperone A
LKEAETQQKRIDKLIADGADEADVRKQVSWYYL